jgi:hypothetical protein
MTMMKLNGQRALFVLAVVVVWYFCLPRLHAQNPDQLLLAESAAKAKSILQQTIGALGGPAYMDLRSSDCRGRYAQFQHSGEVGGYIELRQVRALPDKSRVEYDDKARIADVYAGDQGWTMDRGGVSEEPADVLADYQESLKIDINNILRFRMDDASLIFRYGGTDVVDLKRADWVEIGDHEGHTLRIAIDKGTHLPIRSIMTKRDPKTGERIQQDTAFTSYHLTDGVQIPFRVSRFLNGRQTYEAFLDSCTLNSNLPPDFFTRASLEKHFDELNGKTKKKK